MVTGRVQFSRATNQPSHMRTCAALISVSDTQNMTMRNASGLANTFPSFPSPPLPLTPIRKHGEQVTIEFMKNAQCRASWPRRPRGFVVLLKQITPPLQLPYYHIPSLPCTEAANWHTPKPYRRSLPLVSPLVSRRFVCRILLMCLKQWSLNNTTKTTIFRLFLRATNRRLPIIAYAHLAVFHELSLARQLQVGDEIEVLGREPQVVDCTPNGKSSWCSGWLMTQMRR